MRQFLAIAAVLVIASGLAINVGAQVKQGKTRPLQTKQLMQGLVALHCGGIKDGLEAGPSDDKAWETLAMQAALLNEASYILMEDGRCPDGVWADAATKLREGSSELLAQIEAKDAAAAGEAFKAMTGACGACHKAHKK